MPYAIFKNPDGHTYAVVNLQTGHFLARSTTLKKAESQYRLLARADKHIIASHKKWGA